MQGKNKTIVSPLSLSFLVEELSVVRDDQLFLDGRERSCYSTKLSATTLVYFLLYISKTVGAPFWSVCCFCWYLNRDAVMVLFLSTGGKPTLMIIVMSWK